MNICDRWMPRDLGKDQATLKPHLGDQAKAWDSQGHKNKIQKQCHSFIPRRSVVGDGGRQTTLETTALDFMVDLSSTPKSHCRKNLLVGFQMFHMQGIQKRCFLHPPFLGQNDNGSDNNDRRQTVRGVLEADGLFSRLGRWLKKKLSESVSFAGHNKTRTNDRRERHQELVSWRKLSCVFRH
jgi:hypothetical protein